MLQANSGPLSGLLVIDASWGMPGAVTTCLLADFGADVVKVERPGGGIPSARTHRSTLDRNKRSVELDLRESAGLATAEELIAGADVFVESFGRSGPLPAARTRELNPALVHCSLTAYVNGPWADRPGYEALVAARMGFMAEQPGHRKGPIFLGHPSISYTTGFLGAIATLAALRARRVTGFGQQATVSMLDGVLGQAPMNWWFSENEASYRDTEEKGHFGHRRLLLDMYRCADGEYLMVHSGGQGSFKALMEVLGVGDRFRAITDRPEMSAPLNEDEFVVARQVVPTLWEKRPRDEWLGLLRARDVACVPVLRPGDVLRHEQVKHLDMTVTVDDPDHGKLVQVAPCIRFNEMPTPAPTPAPTVGQHNDQLPEILARCSRERDTVSVKRRPLKHALEGLLVLDFSTFFAAAYGTKLLGDLGADVIKVEPVEGDPMRPLPDPFEACQRGKRTIALDLRTESGRQIAHDLVAKADVVVHNLRPGKAEKIGLDYEQLRQIRPDLIYCYQPGWGPTGPYADQKSFAPLMSALTGLMFAAAGEGNPPVRRARASEDYYGGFLGATAVLIALEQRARAGIGQYVEAPQLSASLFATMEHCLDAEGVLLPGLRLDSDQTGYGPLYRLFPTADSTVCVAAVGVGALGRLRGLLDTRAESAEELSELLAEHLLILTGDEASRLLDAHHIPCEIAKDVPFMPDFFWQDWVVDEQKVFEHFAHPTWGYMREVGQVIALSDTPGVERGPGPLLGEHTREILAELGHERQDVEGLIAAGVVAATNGEN